MTVPERVIKLFEVWAATEGRVRLLVFFRQNPGVVDTLPGLARRLAMPEEELASDVAEYVAHGLLRERQLRKGRVLAFDVSRWREIEEMVKTEAEAGARNTPRGGAEEAT